MLPSSVCRSHLPWSKLGSQRARLRPLGYEPRHEEPHVPFLLPGVSPALCRPLPKVLPDLQHPFRFLPIPLAGLAAL